MTRRLRDSSGVAIIEAAIALPLLLLIALGVLEFGTAWRQANIIERTVQSASRTASNGANGRYTDYETLRAIDAQLGGLARTEIDRVIIYRANSDDGAVPGGCLSIDPSGTSGKGNGALGCNVYGPAQIASSSLGGFGETAGGGCSAGSWDRFWCPTERRRDFNPQPDRVGVYVRLQYSPMTGMFQNQFTLERRAVYQVEPCTAGRLSC